MPTIKSARQAIDEFVEAIVQHYISRHREADGSDTVVEEFASSIEKDLKPILRQRLSMFDAIKEVESATLVDAEHSGVLTITESSEADLGVSIQADDDRFDQTIDAEIDVDKFSRRHEDSASGDVATVELGSGLPSHVSLPSNRPTTSHERDGLANGDSATMADDNTVVMDGSNSTAAPDVPDGYELLGTLGKGGMGVVYKARHIPLNRLVAVKMILQGEHASDEQLRRFQIEAEAAAHLSHPNIVSVYEVGSHRGLPYFSLEFVEGKSMSELMRETTMSSRDAATMLTSVARAVDYSHKKGVLHRDLKPQNILVASDGVPKVADFGLAKRLDDEDGERTTAGVIVGTPGYMAPEQAQCRDDIGPQTDVYALGSVLYYAMTGRPPFVGPTPFETVRQLMSQEPVTPSTLQAGLDRDLETICMKALEKDVDRRYATAGEFADELQRFLNSEPIVARPITRQERLWKWCKRNSGVAALTGIAASLLMCLLFGGIISAIVISKQKQAEMLAKEEAKANEKLADDQAELAVDTARMILYEAKKFFEAKPELRPLRKKMIDSVVAGVEKIHTRRYTNDIQSIFVASADVQLGMIYLEAGVFDKARDKLLEAERKLVVLNQEGKLNRADISQMNISLWLGDTYRKLGELELAQQQYLKLLRLRKQYFVDHPNFSPLLVDTSMAEVYGRLAAIYNDSGKPDDALKYGLLGTTARRAMYDANSHLATNAAELSGALTFLSTLYEKAGDFDKMIDASTESLELQARVAEVRSDTGTRHNTALKQRIVATQCLVRGRVDEAKKLIDESAATYDRLIDISDNQKILSSAVSTYYEKGNIQRRLKQDAAASYEQAELIQRKLIAKSDNVNTQGMLLKVLASAGKANEAIELADTIAKVSGKAMNCGYAAAGYCLVLEQLDEDDPHREEFARKAIGLTRKLIGHGYHDFRSLRETDRDFAALQQRSDYMKMLDEEEAKIEAAAVREKHAEEM